MVKIRTFLESDEYGREYFDDDTDLDGLLEEAAEQTDDDEICRRVGYEIVPDGPNPDDDDGELPGDDDGCSGYQGPADDDCMDD